MQCRLCLKSSELRGSHVIPEFLYKPLYDSKHRAMGIHGQGNKKWQYLQKGLRERLLCEQCEQFLNDQYERYFHDMWFIKSPIPFTCDTSTVYEITVDYPKFKLFHLSVLFRAGVSSLPTFTHVKLGPHEDRLRVMLLNHDPGLDTDYQIFANIVLKQDGSIVQKLISQPIRFKADGHTVYNFMFGGCSWHYMVSSHNLTDFREVALRGDGMMYLSAERWEEEPMIQGLKEILNR